MHTFACLHLLFGEIFQQGLTNMNNKQKRISLCIEVLHSHFQRKCLLKKKNHSHDFVFECKRGMHLISKNKFIVAGASCCLRFFLPPPPCCCFFTLQVLIIYFRCVFVSVCCLRLAWKSIHENAVPSVVAVAGGAYLFILFSFLLQVR